MSDWLNNRACQRRSAQWRSWDWRSDECATIPPPPDAGSDNAVQAAYCRAIGSRRLLYIGDSLQFQMFLSMAQLLDSAVPTRWLEMDWKMGRALDVCGGRAALSFVRNDYLCDWSWDRRCVFDKARSLICRGFAALARSFDVLVLNRGAHTVSDELLVNQTATLGRWLAESWLPRPSRAGGPRRLVRWRTSVPGHTGCALNTTAPLPYRYVPRDHMHYGWHRYAAQNQLVARILDGALPAGSLQYIDAFELSNLRADRHLVHNAFRKRDCLHYCLPGPPDDWNGVLAASLAPPFEPAH